MFEMRKTIFLLFVLLVACSPTPTAISPLTAPPTESAPATPTLAVPTSTVMDLPTEADATMTSGLWLQVISPLDEAVVNTPQIDVTGSAPADTVISVNDDILIVGADGQFKSTVMLEEGPNLIEIIASDEDGNETSVLLTVTYEP
jgi:hypothetical protein